LRRFGLAVVAIVALAPGMARAGNSDSFFFSDEAALMAGAVTAQTRDSGAIWYNPAGLGGITRGQVSLSGSVLILRLRNVPGALHTTVPGANPQTVDLSSTDFTSSPHALGIVRSLNDRVSVGLGVYVTALDLRSAESQVQFPGMTFATKSMAGTDQQRIDLSFSGSHYNAGPAIGWAVLPNLRVGASLFATYFSAQGFGQYALSVQSNDKSPPTQVAFLLAQNRDALTYIGAQAQVGVQWDPVPVVHLGAVVRSPELTFWSSTDGAALGGFGFMAPMEPSAGSFTLTQPQSPFGTFTMVQPLRVILGVAYDIAETMTIAGEADYQTSQNTSGLERQDAVNGRLGWRWQPIDALGLGAGLFTDRAIEASVGPTIADSKVDYYGVAAGVTLRTPVALAKHPDTNPIVLSTTLSARYAIGFGDARAADVVIPAPMPALPPRTVSVVYHEIVPYIGTGVLF
jgi:hypothetical protein